MFEYDLNNVSKKTTKLGTEKIEKNLTNLCFILQLLQRT